MKRVAVFIDGFNIYHALDEEPHLHKYKWLNFAKLAQLFVPRTERIESIYYFTALMTWKPDKMARHKILIRAQELNGVNVVYGQFRMKERYCPLCKKFHMGHEEKQTDVNIAIHLLKLAHEDRYDKALIISGDSDLIPAIKAVRGTFPSKTIGVVIPIGRRAEELKQAADYYSKMKVKHLEASVLPDAIDLGNGQFLFRPVNWK